MLSTTNLEGLNTLNEKDIYRTRELLKDKEKIIRYQEIFKSNAGSNLENVSIYLQNFDPQPLICVDGSQTPPEFNGKLRTTYVSAASAIGFLSDSNIEHRTLVERIQTIDNRKNNRIVDLKRTDLEFRIIDHFGHETNYSIAADGSLENLILVLPEMANLSDEWKFDLLNEEVISNFKKMISEMRLFGITKETNCTCPEKYISNEIRAINLIKHNEICNYLMKPGDLLLDKPFHSIRPISRYMNIDDQTKKSIDELYEVVQELQTYTYKPMNQKSNGTVIRFQIFNSDRKKLLQILKNIEFDKTGNVVEPWCQLKADKEAVYAASIYKSKLEAETYSNNKQLNINRTVPTRLVSRSARRR